MIFTVNNIEFEVREFDEGFLWSTDMNESEYFPTALECQQNAIDFVLNYKEEDDSLTDISMALIDKMYRETL